MADVKAPAPEDRFKDLTRERSAYGHKSDIEIAGMVRMLLRSDLDHEPVCVAARDRIMVLHWELSNARFALAEVLGYMVDERNSDPMEGAVVEWHRRHKAELDAARAQFGAPGDRTPEYEARIAGRAAGITADVTAGDHIGDATEMVR